MESVVSLSAQNAVFTLIELMIVMVIVAIFVTVGVPNFQNLISDNRLSTQANSLVSSLSLARSESLKLRTPVSVCRSADGATCAGAGVWETGWLVFLDTNANGDVDGNLSNGNEIFMTTYNFGILPKMALHYGATGQVRGIFLPNIGNIYSSG